MASSSSSVPDWKYDVFLNFRGEDTRRTFIGHLYKALVQNSINTFIDAEELRKGNCLSQLLTAISDSRLSIVVFSQNYGSSTWCLKELVQILQCMDQKKQIVIPIFYEVDPSHVRKIEGSFEEAFSKHEHDPNADMEEVQRWRSALQRAPDLCGWDSQNYQDDAKLIELIVDDIFKKLINILSREKNGLVGMDSRLQKMDSLLCPEVGNVRFVGIWGMGGIGKTTIARAVYDKINHHFEGRCFLENVKGRFPSTDAGEAPLDMQAEILSSITNTKVGSSQILRNGFQKMMERVGKKKVLFVLDNVESSSQIEALIGKQPAFGGGSRIIITTRDKQSLSRLGDQIYEPELLNDDDAFELFVQYAFSTKQPTEEYIDLSGHFIKYAQGLPLALKVLGAFLDNKSVLVWKDELKKIARNPHLGIQKVLRTSFDELDGLQKEIFLDIACFFKQMKKDFATRIMEGCDFHPHTGLDVLVGRALVSISSDGVLEMHDLIEEMGREIVRQEYIKEPGRRSRLWSYEDVHHVLNKKTATEAVESIIVHWPHSDNVVELDTAFVKMTKLRLLRVHTHSIEQLNKFGIQWQHEDLKFLSEKLSYLFWHKCPLKSLSSYFNPENLVDIDMQYSWVEHLWKGTKPLGKLKIINLKGSHRLKETPDFTEAKNLEKLILVGCTNLYEVHPSISALEKLVLLDLSWCGKLKTFSSNICIKSLETLDLSFCSILEKFPEISEVTEKLSKLYLQGTAIKELPRSINNLMGLVTLNLEYCRELKILPSSIVQLKSLQFLNLSGCPKLKAFPRNVGNMEGLRELRLDETSVEGLCPSISSLQNLESLSLKQCKKLHSLPSSIHMRSLRNLNLSGCSNLDKFSEIPEVMNLSDLILDGTAISELPSSIKNFTRLVTLSLKDCRRLKILPGSIHMKSLQALNVSGCSNLKNFPEFLKVTENLTQLHLDWTVFSSTFKNLTERAHEQASRRRKIVKFSGIAIEELPSIIYSLTGLATLTLRYSKDFKSLTSSICQLKSLNYLSLSGCTNFKVFPDILENMERLASLDLDRTSIRELPSSIERLQGLVSLNLKNCKSLVYLPDSMCNLLSLEWLTLHGCSKLSKLPEDLWYLKHLDIEETGIRGYRPEQRFVTLEDLAQFRSTAPKIKPMVLNNEQNEAVADVESHDSEIATDPEEISTDHEESSYVEDMRQRHLEEDTATFGRHEAVAPTSLKIKRIFFAAVVVCFVRWLEEETATFRRDEVVAVPVGVAVAVAVAYLSHIKILCLGVFVMVFVCIVR
ncbi:disease resistance protein RPV1-like [Pyrus x bretschneideri]|uniref:disease resistance protein RPV1-like n=1 Tax=Pyrus x bretschneideri TaxID=225117 RepID=UPI00202F6A53|nr:disease resistance protein RPV1-like [Pyrus x bretschneideri]